MQTINKHINKCERSDRQGRNGVVSIQDEYKVFVEDLYADGEFIKEVGH